MAYPSQRYLHPPPPSLLLLPRRCLAATTPPRPPLAATATPVVVVVLSFLAVVGGGDAREGRGRTPERERREATRRKMRVLEVEMTGERRPAAVGVLEEEEVEWVR